MRILVIVAALMTFLGCTHLLAEQMVSPPNHGVHLDDAMAEPVAATPGGEQHFSIPVGPPTASLAVWVAEPRTLPARGTVLVLHGFLGSHVLVRGAADALTAAGYRAVLVDLRGHGNSTGEHITFGVAESCDLMQLVDCLVAHKLAGDSIGVYGTSLGAAVAIQYAGIDPRVKAVVAVAPFATLRDETPYFGKTMLPVPGAFLSPDEYAEVLRDAGQIADFDPDKASPLAALAHTKAHILLIHGAIDNIIPADDSRRLHAASPKNTELVILPAHGHLTACIDPTSEVSLMTRDFLQKYLSQADGK